MPTLVFSLPTLPYVTVAHPAHRTEADLREKASLATNQEDSLPSPPSDLALQLGLVIQTPGLWLQENGNISTLSCVTEVGLYHVYHHQVHHIHHVTHSHRNRAIDALSESRVWHCCQLVYSPKSSLRWSLRRTKSSITQSRSTGLAECATRMSSFSVFRPRLKFPGWAMPTLIFSRVGACPPCSPRAGAHGWTDPNKVLAKKDLNCYLTGVHVVWGLSLETLSYLNVWTVKNTGDLF